MRDTAPPEQFQWDFLRTSGTVVERLKLGKEFVNGVPTARGACLYIPLGASQWPRAPPPKAVRQPSEVME